MKSKSRVKDLKNKERKKKTFHPKKVISQTNI